MENLKTGMVSTGRNIGTIIQELQYPFQGIVIFLHRCIVVRTPGSAHALRYFKILTLIQEFFRSELAALIGNAG